MAQKTPEKQVAEQIAGKTLAEVQNIFKSEGFRKIWKELSEKVKKEVLINADVKGLKDVEGLVDALNAATGASEKFFKSIDNYRGTMKNMSLAFREGSSHMKDYLDQAGKSGGKLAVFAAAGTYLLKTFKDQIEAFENSALAARSYRIEQEMFIKTSNYSKGALDGLRSSLNLTKSDMLGLYDTLGEMEAQGFGIENIKGTMMALTDAYGPEGALGLIKSWQNITTKLPLMNKANRGAGATAGDVYNMMSAGTYGDFLKISGASGESKEAELANHNKWIESKIEIITDTITGKMSPYLFDMAKGIGMTSTGISTLLQLVGIAGAIKVIVASIAIKNAIASGGKSVASGVAGAAGGAGIAGGAATGAAIGGALVVGGIGAAILAGILGAFAIQQKNTKAGKDLTWSEFGAGAKENLWNWKGVMGYGGSVKELSEADKARIEAKRQSGSNSYSGGKRRTQEQMKNALAGKAGMKKAFDAMQSFKDRWNYYNTELDQMNITMSDIVAITGDAEEFQLNIKEYAERNNEEYKKSQEFYNNQIKEIEKNKKEMIDKGVFGDAEQAAYDAAIAKSWKGLSESQKEYFDSIQAVIDKQTEEAIRQGGYGFKKQVELRAGVAGAGAGVAEAARSGGEIEALKKQRDANIELAKSNVIALDKRKKELEAQKDQADSEEKKAMIEEELISIDEKRSDAMNKLNSELKNSEYIEVFKNRLARSREVIGDLSSLLTDTNGSFSALQPLMRDNVKLAEQDVIAAQKKFDDIKKGGYKEGTEEYDIAQKALIKAQINAAQESFNYTKKERDMKLSEIELASGWQKEQADYYEEMGGHFGDVISMRVKGIEKERESIAVLENYLASGKLEGKEKFQAEIELERKKMSITKQSIGIQKDAYEKFVGMAFGQLNDIGVKRGRMDDSVLMGRNATRVRNKEGMYMGSGYGASRDQQTAMYATGFNPEAGGGQVPSVEAAKSSGEEQARRATRMEAQRVEVKTQVTIVPSELFTAKVKELVREAGKDQSVINDLINSGKFATTGKQGMGR